MLESGVRGPVVSESFGEICQGLGSLQIINHMGLCPLKVCELTFVKLIISRL